MALLLETTEVDILGTCIRASYSTALRCLSFSSSSFFGKSMLFCFRLKCNILIRIRALEISISCQPGCQASVFHFQLPSGLSPGVSYSSHLYTFSSYSPRKSNHINELRRGRWGVDTALKSGNRVRRSRFDHCPHQRYTVSLDTCFPSCKMVFQWPNEVENIS